MLAPRESRRRWLIVHLSSGGGVNAQSAQMAATAGMRSTPTGGRCRATPAATTRLSPFDHQPWVGSGWQSLSVPNPPHPWADVFLIFSNLKCTRCSPCFFSCLTFSSILAECHQVFKKNAPHIEDSFTTKRKFHSTKMANYDLDS